MRDLDLPVRTEHLELRSPHRLSDGGRRVRPGLDCGPRRLSAVHEVVSSWSASTPRRPGRTDTGYDDTGHRGDLHWREQLAENDETGQRGRCWSEAHQDAEEGRSHVAQRDELQTVRDGLAEESYCCAEEQKPGIEQVSTARRDGRGGQHQWSPRCRSGCGRTTGRSTSS